MSERRIKISAGSITVAATLDDSPMASEMWDSLPIDGRAETWGDEIYFSTSLVAPPNAGRGVETVSLGAIGYWPPGKAICLFFGPTPMSRGNEIRPASAVHVMGTMEEDPKVLKKVPAGTPIHIEATE